MNLWLDTDSVNASGDTMIYILFSIIYMLCPVLLPCRMLMGLRFLTGFRADGRISLRGENLLPDLKSELSLTEGKDRNTDVT